MTSFRLLRIVSTDFVLALCLFCFNTRQHGRQILYFKLRVDCRKFHLSKAACGRATAGCAPLLYMKKKQ